MLGIADLYGALPRSLMVVGPRWLLVATVAVLLLPTVISHRTGHHFLNEVLGYLLNGTVTLAMIGSLTLLIAALPAHEITPQELLRSAAALWVSNILIFASWY